MNTLKRKTIRIQTYKDRCTFRPPVTCGVVGTRRNTSTLRPGEESQVGAVVAVECENKDKKSHSGNDNFPRIFGTEMAM